MAGELVEHARAEGLSLIGPDGLLGRLTKMVLEAELTGHLGYEPHERAGNRNSATARGARRHRSHRPAHRWVAGKGAL